MNILQAWQLLFSPAHSSPTTASKPGVMNTMLCYVLPLSLLTPFMLWLVVPQYPSIFTDILPANRLAIVLVALFVLQLVAVPVMAVIVKYTAEMVDIKPSYGVCIALMAVAATPLWLASLCYWVPSFAFNITMHCVAGLIASALVYFGIKNILGLQRRGARIMLTIAVVTIAAIAFGVVLVITLMLWDKLQLLQFAAH